jgi:putative hydrolase of the HAD superfamily
MIRAVLFDAAGTLFDVAEPVGETYARFAGREGIAADPRALDDAFHAAFARSKPLAFPHAPAADLPSLERGWWKSLVFDAFERAGIDAPPEVLDRAFAEVFEHYASAAAWRTYADAKPVLRRLRDRGLRLGVVSNFDARLRRLLDALDLAPAFDAVVLSSECGAAKPDRRIFEAALHALHSPATAALHVGDSEELDRRGAAEAGLSAVRLDRGGVARPDVVTQLDQILERFFDGR